MPLNKIKHTALASNIFDNIADDQIVLNSGLTGAPTGHVGIVVNRGHSTDVEIRYNETLDYWEITNDGTTYNRIATTGGAAGIGNVSEDATPQLGGDLESNSHDIQMADNDKVAFGTGEKGKIDHNGSLLQIFETTGGIDIKTFADNSSIVISSDDSLGGIAPYFKADGSTGESILYWYGTERLKASNNGIIVTGTLNTHTIPAGTGTLALTSQVASDTDGLTEGSTNKYYSDAQVATYLAGGSVSNVIIGGNLTVNGTQTTVNSNNVNIGDNIITLNSDETGVPSLDAGIEIERGSSTNVVFRWNETNDKWEFTNDGSSYTELGESDLVGDTTPQLGGNLDVNGHAIVSTSNGNIPLTPNGTGVVMIDGNVGIESGTIDLKNSGSVSNIKFYCESSNLHYTQLQSAPHSAYSGNITVTLPTSTGTLLLNVVEDTTPQLGGTLDANGNNIDLDGNDLILDADGDTKIYANVDDELNLYAQSGKILFNFATNSLRTYEFTNSGATFSTGPGGIWPDLYFKRNYTSNTPAAGDKLAQIHARGEDSNGNTKTYVSMEFKAESVIGTLDRGSMTLSLHRNNQLVDYYKADATSGVEQNIFYKDIKADEDVKLIFEGATANTNDTTLTVTDPTGNNTITLPDATGTVALTSDIPSLSGYLQNVSEDTTPQLGANLDVNGKNITNSASGKVVHFGDAAVDNTSAVVNFNMRQGTSTAATVTWETDYNAGGESHMHTYYSQNNATNGPLARFDFYGHDDAGNDTMYAMQKFYIKGAVNGSECGAYQLSIIKDDDIAGSGTAGLIDAISINGADTNINVPGVNNGSFRIFALDLYLQGNASQGYPNLLFDTGTYDTAITATTGTAHRTITLPNASGTVITTGNADAATTTTSDSDADHVLIDDGGVLKKITPADLGIGDSSAAKTFSLIQIFG
tara:strand:+ start:257 stop:3031 length:2775 start_codon:yes stop_codon:yes gene_type:complete